MLILHLKRYGFDNFTEEQAKKQDKVKIERFINLSEYQHLSLWQLIPIVTGGLRLQSILVLMELTFSCWKLKLLG